MGRKTWDSIPSKYRPLNGRLNVVLSRNKYNNSEDDNDNVVVCGSFSSALDLLSSSRFRDLVEKVFVIGGGQILRDTMNGPGCEAIHITEIETSIACDTFIPHVDTSLFRPWHCSLPLVENGIQFSFVSYVRVKDGLGRVEDFGFLPKMVFHKHDEFVYLRLVEEIVSNNVRGEGLTETTTVSKFGCQMRYNLRKCFPLLTTQDVSWRQVVKEFLWFLDGSIEKVLPENDDVRVEIGNGSNDVISSVVPKDGEESNFGPVQGFQWRNFGVRYANADYLGQEFDLLPDLIDKIKSKPGDKGCAIWNPSDLKLTESRSCHVFAQFYVVNGELSCQVYQKSGDIALEVPLSIASYALLTCTIAHVCDLLPGDLIHMIGNAHVRKTRIRPLQEQIHRHPKPFPILRINSSKKDIDRFIASDFELTT